MASSSLVLQSITPKSLVFSQTINKPSISLLFPSLSLKTTTKPISITSSFLSQKKYSSLPSRFVRNVAVTSEFEQDEVSSDEGEQSFSEDLKLFVGNLPFTVDSAELADLFGQAGTVQMVEVIYDKMTGRSRGFGFVTMSSVQEVEAAAQQLNGYELAGRPIRVNYGPPPPKDNFGSRAPRGGGSFNSGKRVYVGNLSWGVDDSALEALFSEQGQVVEARVVMDRETGRSRGFGFVTYSSDEEVNNAIQSLDGADLDGRSIRVSQAEERQRRQF